MNFNINNYIIIDIKNNMYIDICTYIYICMYVYICTYLSTYTYVDIHCLFEFKGAATLMRRLGEVYLGAFTGG